MSKRFPFYMTQSQLDELAQVLYTHQYVIDVVSTESPSSDRAFRMLSELRRQCCIRSKAADPFEDLPLATDEAKKRRPAC